MQEREKKTEKSPASKKIHQWTANQKQTIQLTLFFVCISLALVAGFYFLFSSNVRENPKTPDLSDPYAVLSSYLAEAEKRPAASANSEPLPTASLPIESGMATIFNPTDANANPTNTSPTQAPATASPTPTQTTPTETESSKEGELLVDSSAENRFIRIVLDQDKELKPALLTAIYTLPDKGQNYVLEWNGQTDKDGKIIRSADTIRRCYLIDKEGKIDSVAATDEKERVNISRTENAVSMNTLIKKILIPAVEGELVG